MRIILASKSARRTELLNMIGIIHEIIVSNADETFIDGLSLENQSKRLALIKAKAVFEKTSGDRIVIGSDTMVEKNGVVYGKPKDKNDAIRMLRELKNGKHRVFTSLAILAEKNGKYFEYNDLDIAFVWIQDMTEKEIVDWVEKDNPVDKAGAYAIQSKFSVFIEKTEGNFFTVVGLPINKVYNAIKQIDNM